MIPKCCSLAVPHWISDTFLLLKILSPFYISFLPFLLFLPSGTLRQHHSIYGIFLWNKMENRFSIKINWLNGKNSRKTTSGQRAYMLRLNGLKTESSCISINPYLHSYSFCSSHIFMRISSHLLGGY